MHRSRTRGLGVHDLEREAAAATLDQRDRAGGEAGEVVRPGRVGRERRPDGGFGERSVAPARVARGHVRLMSTGTTAAVTVADSAARDVTGLVRDGGAGVSC